MNKFVMDLMVRKSLSSLLMDTLPRSGTMRNFTIWHAQIKIAAVKCKKMLLGTNAKHVIVLTRNVMLLTCSQPNSLIFQIRCT